MANEEIRQQNIATVLKTAIELFFERGLEAVTQRDIAEASGVSVASINRYFVNKTDLIIKAAEYVGRTINRANNFDKSIFTDGKHSGRELLYLYLKRMEDDFFSDRRRFVLRAEYEVYLYRSNISFADGKKKLEASLCLRPVLQKILAAGKLDKTLPVVADPQKETEFLSEIFLGFLSGLALRENDCQRAKRDIDTYIDLLLKLYANERVNETAADKPFS